MAMAVGPPAQSIVGDEGDPDPDPDNAVDQDSDPDLGVDEGSDSIHLDPGVSEDVADPSALQYPALEGSMEPSSSPVTDAADLSVADWAAIIKRNQLLYGFSIREQAQDVVRAREQGKFYLVELKTTFNVILLAFILRGRQSSLGTGGTNASQAVVPDFQIEDGSSIQVRETKNEFQRQLALKSFSARCIESNLSAGDFGIMAGITGSRSRKKSSSEMSRNTRRDQEYYAVFNFPRARLMLDEENLQLSEECRNALLEIQNQPTYSRLQRFYKIFGHVVVTSLVLGGQQRTSKYAASLEINNDEVQQDALRGAIGANVNAQYLSASVKGTKEQGKSENRSDQKYSDLSYLGMSAIGGDPLIGSDVPKWASTVAPWKNWRVIEHEIAVPIHELIGLIPGWDHVPELFNTIMKNRTTADRPWRGRLTLLLHNRPLRWHLDSKSLCPVSAPDNDTGKEPVLHAMGVDAKVVGHEEAVQELRADWPYYLFTNKMTGQLDVRGLDEDSLYSIFVGSDGSLKPPGVAPEDINRFSFRLAGTTGKWNPLREPPRVIQSGDQVNLYCHSVGVGPYASASKPPTEASPVLYAKASGKLFVPVQRTVFESPDRDLIQQFDSGRLSKSDKSAFEKMGLVTGRELAPGPTQIVENTRSLGGKVGVTGVQASFQKSTTISKEYTLIDGKRDTIDYKKLQKPKYDRMDLDWGHSRETYLSSIYSQQGIDVETRIPATFTVLFE